MIFSILLSRGEIDRTRSSVPGAATSTNDFLHSSLEFALYVFVSYYAIKRIFFVALFSELPLVREFLFCFFV